MEIALIILIVILIAVVVFLALRKTGNDGSELTRTLSEVRKELQDRMDRIDDQLDKSCSTRTPPSKKILSKLQKLFPT